MARPLLLALLAMLFLPSARCQAPAPPSTATVLSWFPADTETFLGVTGPIPMPALSTAPDHVGNLEPSKDPAQDTLQTFFFLQLLALKDFKGTPVLIAVQGARDFRMPSGLGLALYQGAQIAVFDRDVTPLAQAFLKNSASKIIRTDTIAGHSVAVFTDKGEGAGQGKDFRQDILTSYVVFPRPNLAVVASDLSFLTEVLARIDGRPGPRALPDTLPEWKYVDTHSRFWAIHHFRHPAGAGLLPSGFNQTLVPGSADADSTGLAFHFDPQRSATATITYLARNDATLQPVPGFFPPAEEGVKELRAEYRTLAPGVLQGAYNLAQTASAQMFALILINLLGFVTII